jgi:hypothetical protein
MKYPFWCLIGYKLHDKFTKNLRICRKSFVNFHPGSIIGPRKPLGQGCTTQFPWLAKNIFCMFEGQNEKDAFMKNNNNK